jgi:hypothetical protein
MSEQPGKYQRSTGGLVGAMLVLLAVVAAFVAFRALVREEAEVEVRSVDYQQAAGYARDQVDFPILVPDPMPAGWRATSVDFVPRPGRWSLGMLTDGDRYVGLVQAERTVENLVEAYVDADAEPGPTVVIDGARWDSWTDEDGDTAVTRDGEGPVVLVVSPAGLDVITELVESLSATK